jgi:sugar/nucleoside kinase (ribokinase family)
MEAPHLVAIGDALADFVVAVGPGTCERLGVEPGAAAFRSCAALDDALAGLSVAPAGASAGGGAANTCAAFAASGGSASLLTALMEDELARRIADDLLERGVALPVGSVSGGATGRCLVLVVPGGERAFLIWQGEPWRLRALRAGMAAFFAGVPACDGLLVEGYLVATEDGMEVARSAMERAAVQGAPRILTLSDHRLVSEHRGRFDALVAAGVEAVIGNEAEVTAMAGTDDVERAAAAVSRMGPLAVVTLGDRGALAHGPDGRHLVAASSARVASALGAGDAFAGGFLFGLLSGSPLSESLALGCGSAGSVLSFQQARAPARPRAE